MVISLIEEHELCALQVEGLPAMVKNLKMEWRHLPIRHRYPPARRFETSWAETGAEILRVLKAGQRLFVHGKNGLGRTGTFAAILLVESGMLPEQAIARVRAARPNAIETAVQEWRVMIHEPR